jgi:hypothetical protein
MVIIGIFSWINLLAFGGKKNHMFTAYENKNINV